MRTLLSWLASLHPRLSGQRDSHGPSPVLGSGEPPTAHSSCSGRSPAPQPLSALGPQAAERLLLWHSGGRPGPSLCSGAPQEGLGTHFHGGHRGCLGSRQCSVLQQHHMQVLIGVAISSGLPFAPGQRVERPGPNVLTSGNPWGGLRPETILRASDCLPKPSGGLRPAPPQLSLWPGLELQKDSLVRVTGAPHSALEWRELQACSALRRQCISQCQDGQTLHVTHLSGA